LNRSSACAFIDLQALATWRCGIDPILLHGWTGRSRRVSRGCATFRYQRFGIGGIFLRHLLLDAHALWKVSLSCTRRVWFGCPGSLRK
jgi:hypothetical protein